MDKRKLDIYGSPPIPWSRPRELPRSASLKGLDLVIEGTARNVTDRATLDRLAKLYAAQGWPPTVDGEALTAPQRTERRSAAVASVCAQCGDRVRRRRS